MASTKITIIPGIFLLITISARDTTTSNKKEIVTLKEKVDAIDPDAFVIVCDVREVHGEGFIEKK